jgi:murein DD-endopeptidase MepM/ murein hydrolase activator NlpD
VSTLGWVSAGVLCATAIFLGSIVRFVPPDDAAPVTTVVTSPAPQPTPSQSVPPPRPVTLAEHQLLTVPVQGVARSKIVDTWGQSRANGARVHQATDIMAPGGTPVIAAAPGTVEKLFYSNGGGGITLYVRSPDRKWSYYYAHLQDYAPGLHEGQVVAEGELIGFVGDTGNAGTGNFHLHFGMSRMGPADRWWQGEPVNPYPLLAGTAPPG